MNNASETKDFVAQPRKTLEIKCVLCNTSFSDCFSYENHWSIKHNDVSVSLMYETPFRCNVCKHYFKSQRSLLSHRSNVFSKCKSQDTTSASFYFSCQPETDQPNDELKPMVEAAENTAVLNVKKDIDDIKDGYTSNDRHFYMIPLLRNAISTSKNSTDKEHKMELNIVESLNNQDEASYLSNYKSTFPMPMIASTFSVTEETNLFDLFSVKESKSPVAASEEFTSNTFKNDLMVTHESILDSFSACDVVNAINSECSINTIGDSSLIFANNECNNLPVTSKNVNENCELKNLELLVQSVDLDLVNQMKIKCKNKCKPDANERFFCRVCGYRFASVFNYRHHFLTKHNECPLEEMFEDSWQCGLCSFITNLAGMLRRHWIIKHADQYDPILFSQFISLEKREKRKRKRTGKCLDRETSGKIEAVINAVVNHSCQGYNSETVDNFVLCHVCGRCFDNDEVYQYHFMNEHKKRSIGDNTIDKDWKCSLCHTGHQSTDDLQVHWQKQREDHSIESDQVADRDELSNSTLSAVSVSNDLAATAECNFASFAAFDVINANNSETHVNSIDVDNSLATNINECNKLVDSFVSATTFEKCNQMKKPAIPEEQPVDIDEKVALLVKKIKSGCKNKLCDIKRLKQRKEKFKRVISNKIESQASIETVVNAVIKDSDNYMNALKAKNSICCRICGTCFGKIRDYRNHFVDKHKEYSIDDMFDDGWKCSLCFAVRQTIADLQLHWQNKHADQYDANLFSDFVEQQTKAQ